MTGFMNLPLVGAGAHICAMLLWERAMCRLLRDWPLGAPSSSTLMDACGGDIRQPFCFIGLSGVYDIVEHYQFESARGVNYISCMRPANGGVLGFPSKSPVLLYRAFAKCLKAVAGFGKDVQEAAEDSDDLHQQSLDAFPDGSGLAALSKQQVQLCGEKSIAYRSLVSLGGLRLVSFYTAKDAPDAGGRKLEGNSLSSAEETARDRMPPPREAEGTDHGAVVLQKLDAEVMASSEAAADAAQKEHGAISLQIGAGPMTLDTTNNEQRGLSGESPAPDPLLLAKILAVCTPKSEMARSSEVLDTNTAAAILSLVLGASGPMDSHSFCAELAAAVAGTSMRQLLPPHLLLCGPGDVVVPPTTSLHLAAALRNLGCKAKVLMYDNLAHGKFACWRMEQSTGMGGMPGIKAPAPSHVAGEESAAVPLIRDVLALVTGEVELATLDWNS